MGKKGETLRAAKTCEKLFVEQNDYYKKTFRGDSNGRGLEELDEELFEGSEVQTTFSQFNAEKYREGVKEEIKNKQNNHNYDDIAIEFFKKYKTVFNDDELLDQEYTD